MEHEDRKPPRLRNDTRRIVGIGRPGPGPDPDAVPRLGDQMRLLHKSIRRIRPDVPRIAERPRHHAGMRGDDVARAGRFLRRLLELGRLEQSGDVRMRHRVVRDFMSAPGKIGDLLPRQDRGTRPRRRRDDVERSAPAALLEFHRADEIVLDDPVVEGEGHRRGLPLGIGADGHRVRAPQRRRGNPAETEGRNPGGRRHGQAAMPCTRNLHSGFSTEIAAST